LAASGHGPRKNQNQGRQYHDSLRAKEEQKLAPTPEAKQ